MKKLSIIRHAKSATMDGADQERPLNDRGERDFKLMGQFLAAQNLNIEYMACSTANRARATLDGLNTALQISDSNITYDDSLYLASLPVLAKYIEALPNTYTHAALVGHNPGLTELCNFLTSSDIGNLPTCAVCHIHFPVDDWQAIEAGLGEQKALWTPKILKEFLGSL